MPNPYNSDQSHTHRQGNRSDSIYPDASAKPNLFAHDNTPAVDMIRQKIDALYADEPDAQQEIAEIEQQSQPGSKHQQYMSGLQKSGKTMTEIQVAWHEYYTALPEHEKYQVWQEFYVQQGASVSQSQPVQAVHAGGHTSAQSSQPVVQAASYDYQHEPASLPTHHTLKERSKKRTASAKIRTAANKIGAGGVADSAAGIKKRVLRTVKTASAKSSGGPKVKSKRRQAVSSLLFGLGCGAVVVFILMFSFFNELLIAPLIQPSRKANNTPVIVNTASVVIGNEPKVLIPKINLEIPVDYSQTTTNAQAIELALDSGVVHYPTTVKPGETGNAAFFGHSSNNIFNPGKYKFAFVLLSELVEGDTFYLTRDSKVYAYKVFKKEIVKPSQVSVLDPIPGHSATATLITCDPPGTSINRLVVVGDQISPDPNTNSQSDVQTAVTETTPATTSVANGLPGNGPSLWSRLIGRLF